MLNFNVDPYYDDFDPSKNFHRILFKPGRAVQARELTQSQTILQDQVSKFADHVFSQNTPVKGGQVTVNSNAVYIKLNTTYNDNDVVAADYLNQVIFDADTATVYAKVVATEETVAGDPPTLIVTYLSGKQFQAGDVITTSEGLSAQVAPSDYTGFATTASVSEGVFYIVNGYSYSDTQNPDGTYSRYSIGNFVSVQPQTIIVQKYGNTPTKRIGLTISEYISDYVSDPSLLDPAVGATNYQAPGADRYTIKLILDTKNIALGGDSGFIELVRVTEGKIQRLVDGTVYGVINDYFAKRTYDTNGDFVVNDFKLVPRANADDDTKYQVQVGTGVAYIKGYRVESTAETVLNASRARTTESVNNNYLTIDYGNYIKVNNLKGFFDTTKVIQVDFHVVNVNSAIVTTNTTTYNSTKAGSAFLRGLDYSSATDTANVQTYVYEAYLAEFKNSTLTGTAASGTSANLVITDTNGKFSSVANAYYGVSVSIDSGTSAGDVRKVVSYNGTTKTLIVDAPWTVAPDSTSNFTLRFNTGNYNMVVAPTSSGDSRSASAGIDPSSKTNGIISGVSNYPTVISNPTSPELVFQVGYPYLKNLSDQSYETWKTTRSVTFSSGVTTFSLSGVDATFLGTPGTVGSPHIQSASEVLENWIVIDNSTGNPLNLTTGSSTAKIELDSSKKIATITYGSSTFTGTIIARAAITNAGTTSLAMKIKNLYTANTTNVNLTGTNVGGIKVDLTNAQVYIPHAKVVTPGTAQSLYISDVKRIVKIIDSLSPLQAPTDAMLTNNAYDVTNNFLFSNGQNDLYYGHANITLKPGAPQPKGDLLVLVDYYQHGGGDGYFCVNSYLGGADGGVSSKPENYAEIGTYTGKKSGASYSLKDCVDFRLSTVNAQATVEFKYSSSVSSTGGALIPTDQEVFISDYTHYLGRNDILVLTKENSLKLIEGKASNAPTFPQQPDGSLLLAKITLDPYTAFVPGETVNSLPNLSMEKVQHKRWRMQDISDLQTRVNNLEYYTSLSLLEKQASDLQIPDSNGFNRFKNGILVDNFSSYSAADVGNLDYNAKINKRLTYLTAADWQLNAPLFSKDVLNSLGNLSEAAQAGQQYKYHSKTGGTSSVFTLPYTTANLAVQKLASSTISLNPFGVEMNEGSLDINPPMDMWIQAGREPDIVVVDPAMTMYREGSTLNVLSNSDWQSVTGTSYAVDTGFQYYRTAAGAAIAAESGLANRYVGVERTYADQQRSLVSGNYDKVTSLTGTFLTDISVQPYIRGQNLIVRAKGMKINTPVSVYFDGQKVDDYIVQPNIVVLTDVSGTFNEGDVVGYMSAGSFVPTGRVVSVTKISSTSVRLLLTSDNKSTTYSSTNVLQTAKFNEDGVYTSTGIASGTYSSAATSQVNLKGYVASTSGGTSSSLVGGGTYVTGTTTVTLGPLASSVDSFYNGSTIKFTTTNQTSSTNRVVVGREVTCDDNGCYWQDVVRDDVTWESFSENFPAVITAYNGTTKVATLSTPVNISSGSNRKSVNAPTLDITSSYTIIGSTYLLTQATASQKVPRLSTDENGNFAAIFEVPGGMFKTGDRTLRVDNRSSVADPDSATTFAQGIFTASSIATKSQSLNFGGTIQAAAKSHVFTSTQQQYNVLIKNNFYGTDPVAQTFIIDQQTYPNGAFIKSIKVFFRSKPTGTSAPPVKLYIVDTLNGYPSGQALDGTMVTKTVNEIKTSDTPQYLDQNTYTEFEFDYPVYIRPGNLYAFIVQTPTPDYLIWTAQQNQIAIPSTTSEIPPSQQGYNAPTTITKIGGTPYVGSLFESQNGITWTADQTKQMMFTIENCVFDTAANPSIQFVVPKKIPQRKMVNVDLEYNNNANTVVDTSGIFFGQDVKVDALNVTTVDFTPTSTSLNYEYTPTLYSSYASDITKPVQPGKYGTSMSDHIYFDDGQGSRVLDSNSSTSFILTADMSTTDKYVSPVISDDGLSVYAIQYLINDMGIANTDVTVTSGNVAGVTAIYTSAPTVSISAPTGIGGTQAYAQAHMSSIGSGNYVVDKIEILTPGSGYIATPTISIASNGTVSATATVAGETSAKGGNGWVRYITKKVVLTPENDSGDLRVYYTAYKPVNSDIYVYYKILNRNDTEAFDDQNWQLMTDISAGRNDHSLSRDDVMEFVAAPGTNNNPDNKVSYTSTSGVTYTEFSQFAIKIVLASPDSARTPVVHDLRVLALPSGA